jgi:hypothetical protein
MLHYPFTDKRYIIWTDTERMAFQSTVMVPSPDGTLRSATTIYNTVHVLMQTCMVTTQHTLVLKKDPEFWTGPQALCELATRFEESGGMPQPVPSTLLSMNPAKARSYMYK